MTDLTPERLQQMLYDSLQKQAGKPFDARRAKDAMVKTLMAAVPEDIRPDPIIHAEDGDYRVKVVTDEPGGPYLRFTPIVYTVTLTIDPNRATEG